MAAAKEIRLSQALLKLGLSWAQGYRAILTGRLAGRQEANGRWMVTEDSVDAYRKAQAAGSTAAA